MARGLRKLLQRAVIQALPCPLRYALFRSRLRFDYQPPAELEVRLARNDDDLEAAFRLLHDAYVAEGFMRPHPSGLRVTPYHALPSTSTFVALWGGQVVATMSLIRDGAFGLPCDRIFDLSARRRIGRRLAEPSALAVHRDFRHKGQLLFPLQKFLTEYSLKFFGIDEWVISVNPRDIPMYEGILAFRRFTGPTVPSYDFANGAPAVGFYADLPVFFGDIRRRYAGADRRRNLHHYMIEASLPNLVFPARPYHKISDPVMTPDSLRRFFLEETDVFARLSQDQWRKLQQIYRDPSYITLFGGRSALTAGDASRALRFDQNSPGVILPPGRTDPIGLTVKNVSSTGFAGRLAESLPPGQTVRARLAIADRQSVQVSAQTVWTDGQGFHGFRILSADAGWSKFQDYLQRDLYRCVKNQGMKVAA